MVKVIDKGPDPSVVKHKVCDNCGAKLEYVKRDILRVDSHDYSGDPDGYEFIFCPNCNHRVILRSW